MPMVIGYSDGWQTIKVNELGTEILIALSTFDTLNLNPGGSVLEFLPTNWSDICLLKYDGFGNLNWHEQINSTNGNESIYLKSIWMQVETFI